MYSQKHKEKLLAVMRSPLNLCQKLDLRPTAAQYDLLERLAESPGLIEVGADSKYEIARAVATAAVWRVLTTPGSNCIVLASNERSAGDFMAYLEALTKRRNADLAELVSIPTWKVIQFGSVTGWEIRLLRNRPAFIEAKAPDAIMSVVLDARNDDPGFFEACRALEEHSTHPKHTMVKIW